MIANLYEADMLFSFQTNAVPGGLISPLQHVSFDISILLFPACFPYMPYIHALVSPFTPISYRYARQGIEHQWTYDGKSFF